MICLAVDTLTDTVTWKIVWFTLIAAAIYVVVSFVANDRDDTKAFIKGVWAFTAGG